MGRHNIFAHACTCNANWGRGGGVIEVRVFMFAIRGRGEKRGGKEGTRKGREMKGEIMSCTDGLCCLAPPPLPSVQVHTATTVAICASMCGVMGDVRPAFWTMLGIGDGMW